MAAKVERFCSCILFQGILALDDDLTYVWAKGTYAVWVKAKLTVAALQFKIQNKRLKAPEFNPGKEKNKSSRRTHGS